MAGESGIEAAPISPMGGSIAGEQADFAGEDQARDGVTPEQFAELQAKAAKAEENWDKFVRISADLDNYKKRALRERQDAVKYANEAFIEKLLPIVDNFEAAIAAASAPAAAPGGGNDSLRVGINMIYSQLKNFLADAGVEEIDALNKPFDPNLHEAVSQQPSEEVPEGTVVQQMRKGYRLKERLIRPAMVVVAKKP